MKKVFFLVLFFTTGISDGFGASGIWEYYINTSYNGTPKNHGNYGGGTSFNGSILATHVDLNSGALIIDLTGCKTFQNSGDNVHTVRMYYRVYKQGGATGGFSQQNLSYLSGDGNPNKEWQNGGDIDLLGSLTETGTYVVEIYYEADGVSSGGVPFQVHEPTTGTSHVATFTVATPLPVDLTFFRASLQLNKCILSWQTASEFNNSHFEIEGSNDVAKWLKIGHVNGAGNSSELNGYTFTVSRPINEINYYRLKQVDFNGDFNYSNVVSVRLEDIGNLRVYPNPTGDYLFFESTEIQENGILLNIYNVQGVLIKEIKVIADSNKIMVDDLNTGSYYLIQKNSRREVVSSAYFFKK